MGSWGSVMMIVIVIARKVEVTANKVEVEVKKAEALLKIQVKSQTKAHRKEAKRVHLKPVVAKSI